MKYYYNAQITEFEREGETDYNIEIPDFDEEIPVFENFGEQVFGGVYQFIQESFEKQLALMKREGRIPTPISNGEDAYRDFLLTWRKQFDRITNDVLKENVSNWIMFELDLKEGQKNLRESEDAFAKFEKEHKEHEEEERKRRAEMTDEEIIEEIRTRHPYMTEHQIEMLAEVYRFLPSSLIFKEKETKGENDMIKRVFKIILIASAIILFLDTMQNKLAVNAALREAKVTEVLNGNTIKVWMDKEGYEETVQLIGIDPKNGAQEYVHSYFEENGNTVYLQSDKNDVGGKKHKKLRYVWVEKPKKINSMMSVRYSMLNAMMIEDGYATPKEEYGNVKYQEDFQNIYEQAFCDE